MPKKITLREIIDNIKPDERVCHNCQSYVLIVGIMGPEFTCGEEKNLVAIHKPKQIHPTDPACKFFGFTTIPKIQSKK